MSTTSPLRAAEAISDLPTLSKLHYGRPKFDRRLSDKILAAYNHAYAIGELELADRIWNLLKRTEEKEANDFARWNAKRFGTRRQRTSSALHQAALWKEYVDCRTKYQTITLRPEITAESAEEAKVALKHSYAMWTLS